MITKKMKESKMQSILNTKIPLPEAEKFFNKLRDNHELWEELLAVGYRKMGVRDGLARRYALGAFMKMCNIDKSSLQITDLYRIEKELL